MSKRLISVRLDEKIYKQLKEMKEKQNLSISNLIEKSCNTFINKLIKTNSFQNVLSTDAMKQRKKRKDYA